MSERRDRFAVFGQIAQDLVLRGDALPEPDESVSVSELRWLLGGKGANQAVGLRQLGGSVAIVGVVGEDDIGERLVTALLHDAIDVCGVVRRGGSAVLVDVVDRASRRMLLEHVPPTSLLTVADVEASASAVSRAATICLQSQQPGDALSAALMIARRADATVALDGAPEPEVRDELLAGADVVRADATEAEGLTGIAVSNLDSAHEACRWLLARGPRIAAVEVAGEGDLVVWEDGSAYRAHDDDETVVDRTGGGDAFFVGLVRGIANGWSMDRVADLAARAAASTVARLGGRPELAHLVR